MTFLGDFYTIGSAWMQMMKYIAFNGKEVETDSECYKEVGGIIANISVTDGYDYIIEKFANKSNISWMEDNFKVVKSVEELKNTNSYASRLYNYAGEKNQISWAIKKINNNKLSRSVTITTFEPLTDEWYIPCICLLDFDIHDKYIDVYVYARSLDIGNKVYANIICINNLLREMANRTNLQAGVIHLICKSAHVYREEYSLMEEMCKECK